MGVGSRLAVFSLFLLVAHCTHAPFDSVQLKKAVGALLEVDPSTRPSSAPTRSRTVASRYMKQLYEESQKLGVDGTVRSVVPTIEYRGGEFLLVFPLSHLKLHRTLIRADLHIIGTVPYKAARLLRPLAITDLVSFDAINLPLSSMSEEGVSWSATKAMRDAGRNASALVIKMSRTDGVSMRPLDEFVRRHAPFLTVYIGNEEGEKDVSLVSRRQKRSADGHYEVFDEKLTKHVESVRDRYARLGPAILNTRVKNKKFTRRRYDRVKSRQPFWGFGEEHAVKEEEEKNAVMRVGEDGKETLERMGARDTLDASTPYSARNDVDVVLLKEKQPMCKRNTLHVHFKEIGWADWVIAPEFFDAGYCDGDCPIPLPNAVRASNHAIIQSAISSTGKETGLPSVCCAPDRMDSLSILYIDAEGNVAMKSFSRMVVTSCGCL